MEDAFDILTGVREAPIDDENQQPSRGAYSAELFAAYEMLAHGAESIANGSPYESQALRY